MTATFDAFDAKPTRTGVILAILPGTLAAAAIGTSPLAALAAVAGIAVLGSGVYLGSRRVVTGGTVLLFGAVLLASVIGVSLVQITVAAAATIVAWDAGANAIGVARQLGSRAATRRILVVHTLSTTLVAGIIGTGSLAVFWLTRGGEPTAAVAMLLVAGLAFVWFLDR